MATIGISKIGSAHIGLVAIEKLRIKNISTDILISTKTSQNISTDILLSETQPVKNISVDIILHKQPSICISADILIAGQVTKNIATDILVTEQIYSKKLCIIESNYYRNSEITNKSFYLF